MPNQPDPATKPLYFRIPVHTHKVLKSQAEASGVGFNSYIRALLSAATAHVKLSPEELAQIEADTAADRDANSTITTYRLSAPRNRRRRHE